MNIVSKETVYAVECFNGDLRYIRFFGGEWFLKNHEDYLSVKNLDLRDRLGAIFRKTWEQEKEDWDDSPI